MYDEFGKAEHLAPSKATQSSNDQLIPINDDHNQQSYSRQVATEGNNCISSQPSFSNLDPTLDLTTPNNNIYNNSQVNIDNHLIINESETILPDVACVNQANSSIHSYGSNQDGENQPLLKRFDTDSTQLINNSFPDDSEFTGFIRDVEQAIENGFLPQRISQGSSGSYFVKNGEGNVCCHFFPNKCF